jgi:hypothetical protein
MEAGWQYTLATLWDETISPRPDDYPNPVAPPSMAYNTGWLWDQCRYGPWGDPRPEPIPEVLPEKRADFTTRGKGL